jgi:hypothetical protein
VDGAPSCQVAIRKATSLTCDIDCAPRD